MGFMDVSTDTRQMMGFARPLRIEAGCNSSASTTMSVPTGMRHVVGGLCIGCLTSTGSMGNAVIGSTCEGGIAEFTMNYAPAGRTAPYILIGW